MPGRRAGIAQILLNDIPAAVAEVRWAKEAGLTGGILLPGVPPNSGLPELYDGAYYEPLWAVCAELGMPVNHHGGSASPPMTQAIESPVIFLLEVTWFSHRALAHLIVSGALERHPDLQLVFTEQGTAWIPDELARLDYFFHRMRTAVGSQEHVWGKPVTDRLSLSPSEYFARQCNVGASFIRPAEVPLRHAVGLDKIMWGTDYPHKEASTPYTSEALRAAFAGVPHDETAMMLGGNAARHLRLRPRRARAARPAHRPAGQRDRSPAAAWRRADGGREVPGARRLRRPLTRSRTTCTLTPQSILGVSRWQRSDTGRRRPTNCATE